MAGASGRSALGIGAAAGVVAGAGVGAVLAFLHLDWVLAAAIVIPGAIVVAVVLLARDWDSHPSFEERERVRAQRRKVKHDRGAEARAKDRERWVAHQAKQAEKAERTRQAQAQAQRAEDAGRARS